MIPTCGHYDRENTTPSTKAGGDVSRRKPQLPKEKGKNLICKMISRDVFMNIFQFLPPSYRFVGSVNKEFRDVYKESTGGKCQTFIYGIYSVPLLKTYLLERKDHSRSRNDKIVASWVGARTGQLDFIKWAGIWDRDTCAHAAKEGHIHVLKWLQELHNSGDQSFKTSRCRWDWKTCQKAAEGGQLEVLKYARENGCEWDSDTCSSAAKNGHLEVLTWARENKCDWDWKTCANAATGGNLKVLKWARDRGCEWNAETCSGAAEGGHLEILRWAREQGCPWDEYTCAWAAWGGHLETLKYARKHGCPWDENTCLYAAEGFLLKMSEKAKERLCNVTRNCDTGASKLEHLEVLEWAIANNCPYFRWCIDMVKGQATSNGVTLPESIL